MTSKTHHTRYFHIIVGDDVVTIQRTKERFELQGVYEACKPAFEILHPLKHMGLVIDIRGVVGRADSDFEARFAPVRKKLVSGHPRVAMVVETAVGQLQMSRLIREDRGGVVQRVFTDENAALIFAAGR